MEPNFNIGDVYDDNGRYIYIVLEKPRQGEIRSLVLYSSSTHNSSLEGQIYLWAENSCCYDTLLCESQ